jgi:Tol biopolymer transport system component/serine/threonine protein kinase
MPLTAGTRLGPHEIVGPLDGGGAGELYRARDTRLDRTVIIKVLPPHWTGGQESRERLERDAKIIAGLNHPSVRALHDIGRERPQLATPSAAAGGATEGGAAAEPGADAPPIAEEPEIDFLVLEHLEGETVADRLARASAASGTRKTAAFRVDEALAVATQIADALDKSHQKGLVHRDLKPASVFLVKGGKASDPPVAKLLDLGLMGPAEAGHYAQDPSTLSTVAPGTVQTPAPSEPEQLDYKTPEQVEGKAADARTDIFAFGTLLYEMLTGRRAFEGKSRAVLMAAIMTAEPDPLLALQPRASSALDHVLKRCLAKDPDDRWQTAHDLLIQLKWVAGLGAKAPAVRENARRRVVRLAIAAAAVMAAAMSGPALLYLRGPTTVEAFQYRSPVVGLSLADFSISPDGKQLAFVARPAQGGEPSSLFLRPAGLVDSRRFAGTDDSAMPFWSPDSRYIGFVAGGKLKKVNAADGAPQEIGDAPAFYGGTWNSAGTIVWGSPRGLFRVSAEGGKPEALTSLEKGETGHYWPHFLPDGRHYLYLAWSDEAGNRALYAGTLDTKERKRIIAAESNAVYASGYLIYHREATVFAQPFDAGGLAFTGDAVQIAGAGYSAANGRGNFDVSQRDALVYFQGDAGGGATTGRGATVGQMQFGWANRTGQTLGPAGVAGPYGDMDLSPDGTHVAVTRQEGGTTDIWVIDWQRAGVATRLTLDPGDDINPVWSHDSTRVAFTTYRKGNADIYVKNANGVGDETPLLESQSDEFIEAWSHDGRYIAYLLGADKAPDIYAMPLFGDKKPFPVVQGAFQKDEPQFSYDGKWLAYTSNESGTFQVYVTSFPGRDQREQITMAGGGQPRWRQDGRELYYRTTDNGRLMAVDITLSNKIEKVGEPHALFTPTVVQPNTRDATRHMFAARPDGQRFLLRIPVVATGSQSGTAQANTTFAPGTATSGGRGFIFTGSVRGGRAFTAGEAGLTVLRNWTAVVAK